LHADLLDQARRLATLDARRPKQANLRRAISSAYYAIFHFLVDESCRQFFGTQHTQAAYRHILGRSFEHWTVNEACVSFRGGTLKSAVAKGLPASFTIPLEVKDIASPFALAQELRHSADYDRTERFARSDVLLLVDQIEAVINDLCGIVRVE
jgi:uncharacterized protein (UPF0332 family)